MTQPLTKRQQDVLALMEQGWTFTPGPRFFPDAPPDMPALGFPMRAHPPGPHTGKKPRVEQATIEALLRRGLIRRDWRQRYAAPPKLSPRERILFLLMTDWTIKPTYRFLPDAPPDYTSGPKAELIPPPGYSGEAPRPVRQGPLEALIRSGEIILRDGAYRLPPAPGAARSRAKPFQEAHTPA
jgi:hypothetical protein